MMSMSKTLNDLLSADPLMFRNNVVLQSELSGITHCAQPPLALVHMYLLGALWTIGTSWMIASWRAGKQPAAA